MPAALLAALTGFVLLCGGYHPFAEDGGVYAAGVEKLLDPRIFPVFTAFATEHLRFSLFAWLVAGLVRLTRLPLEWMLLLLYALSVWLTLAAGWALVSRVVRARAARVGAVVVLACGIGVPVAGTSLMLTDPYLTARSFSTPLGLFALAYTMDGLLAATLAQRRLAVAKGTACLALAALLHPLMAAYGLAAVVVLVCASLPGNKMRWRAYGLLTILALLAAGWLQARAPAASSAYTWVAITRYYWFPFWWHWYELLGLAGPLLVLGLLGRARVAPVFRWLTHAGIALGLLAMLVAGLFCRAHLHAFAVARLQPLRCFCTVYLLMLLLLGAWAAERWLCTTPWRWAVLLLSFGAVSYTVDRQTFPASAHLELPGRSSPNAWVEAFRWIRTNTPVDAVFALDARYVTSPGEDAQCFRAIARRSALPDYSKDGGEASITPRLTAAWVAGQETQTGLDRQSDLQREAGVGRLGANWLVLRADAATGFACPYRNAAVKICRMD